MCVLQFYTSIPSNRTKSWCASKTFTLLLLTITWLYPFSTYTAATACTGDTSASVSYWIGTKYCKDRWTTISPELVLLEIIPQSISCGTSARSLFLNYLSLIRWNLSYFILPVPKFYWVGSFIQQWNGWLRWGKLYYVTKGSLMWRT